MLSLRVRVDMGAMAMVGYSTFPKAPGLEPHHQVILCHAQDTPRGELTPLQRCCRRVLQPQPTGLRLVFCPVINNKANIAMTIFTVHQFQVSLFYLCLLSTYCFFIEQYMHILFVETGLCILFKTAYIYIMCILYVSVCVNEFIVSSTPLIQS